MNENKFDNDYFIRILITIIFSTATILLVLITCMIVIDFYLKYIK